MTHQVYVEADVPGVEVELTQRVNNLYPLDSGTPEVVAPTAEFLAGLEVSTNLSQDTGHEPAPCSKHLEVKIG